MRHAKIRAGDRRPPFSGGRRARPAEDRLRARLAERRPGRAVHRRRRRQPTSVRSSASARSTTTRSGRPTAGRSSSPPTATDPPICFASSPTAPASSGSPTIPPTTIRRRSRRTARQLVFVTTRNGGTADLWTLDLQTQKAKALTSGPGGDFRPSWSPDGQWIAFSSDRGSTMPMGHGRWEHLQLADLYLVHPDGTGLKRITEHGNFCGSPKLSADSRRVIAYCMDAEETLEVRRPQPASPRANTTQRQTARHAAGVDRHRDRRGRRCAGAGRA